MGTRIGHEGWLEISLISKHRDNLHSPFQIRFHQHEAKKLSFDQAARHTARLIADRYQNLHVFLSGGLDSEFVAKILLEEHVPFVPVIVVTTKTLAENSRAFSFCRSHGLKPQILNYTQRQRAFETEILQTNLEHCFNYDNHATSICVTIKDLDPTANIVTGYGDPFPVFETYEEPMGDILEISDHDYYFDLMFPDHPGAFFTYTPELFWALINEIDFTLNTQLAKSRLYGIPNRDKQRWYLDRDLLDAFVVPWSNSNSRLRVPAADLQKSFWESCPITK